MVKGAEAQHGNRDKPDERVPKVLAFKELKEVVGFRDLGLRWQWDFSFTF